MANELPREKQLENLGNREQRDLPSLDETRSASRKDLQAALDKNSQKFETFSKLGQIPPGLTMAEIDALTPDQIEALKPMAFGIDMGDGTVVSAAKTSIAQAKETAQKYVPAVSGAHLIEIAERLGDDKHRWESTTTGKCNQFVDTVFRSAGVPLPWDSAHVPDCHGMNMVWGKLIFTYSRVANHLVRRRVFTATRLFDDYFTIIVKVFTGTFSTYTVDE